MAHGKIKKTAQTLNKQEAEGDGVQAPIIKFKDGETVSGQGGFVLHQP
jgi:hypothetical protein